MALTQNIDIGEAVPGAPLLESRWVAVHNPVYLEYQRKDFQFTDIYTTGGFLSLTFASSTGAAEGDIIYISCAQYAGNATVDSLSGNNVITDISVTLPVGTFPGYMNNLTQRPNYFVELQLVDSNATSTILASLRATPDPTGLIGIDISGALQSYVSNIDSFVPPLFIAPTNQNYRDLNSTVDFKYKIREAWRPSTGLIYQSFSSLSSTAYGVNGAFQSGHLYNGNYAQYYLNSTAPAKFITDFVRPKYFRGYPFDVSFLYRPNIATTEQLLTNIIWSGGNTQVITFTDSTQASYLNRYVPYLDFSTATSPVTQLELQVLGVFDDSVLAVTEILNVDVVNSDSICDDSVYLMWLGELGNRSYYLFNNRWTENLLVEGGDTYQLPFNSIETLQERANWYSKKAYKKQTLGAEGLTKNDIDGIKTLLKSTKVEVLDYDYYKIAGEVKRYGVLVEPGSFTIGRGDDNLFNIEFSIVYPEQFNQTA